MDALISIVIPTYNRRELICATVDSVLAQSYREVEVIVVDDGSTDGSGELLRERYAGEPRVRYVYQGNAERAAARNRGIREARGEFIAFLDSDDLWRPAKLQEQLREFDANPEFVLVHTGWSQLYEDGMTLPVILTDSLYRQPNVFAVMVHGDFVGSPTPLVRRWVFDKIGGFNEDKRLNCYEDWEMWTRVSAFGPVGYVAESSALHRVHRGNTEKPVTPEVYRRFVKAVLRNLNSTQCAVALVAAREGFWSRIRDAIVCEDLLTARAYFCSGMSCLGLRMLMGAASNRFAVVSMIFGQRMARLLLSLWLYRSGRTEGEG
jgi:glycosyltransferase involved in cell wall biosynthesis